MFQTSLVNNRHRPLAVGLAMHVLMLLPLGLRPAPMDRGREARPQQVTAVRLAMPTLVQARRPSATKHVESAGRAVESTRVSAALAANPAEPSWQDHVKNGATLFFEVHAEDSLPVLRAHGVILAVDIRRPRGETYQLDLESGTVRRARLPHNVVVRELTDLPQSPDIEAACRRVERELQDKARVFALYTPELYGALKSFTQEVLRQAAVPLESVSVANVKLRLVHHKAFVVTLIGHS